MQEELLSVIIPVQGGVSRLHLDEALFSLSEQDCPAMEVVFVCKSDQAATIESLWNQHHWSDGRHMVIQPAQSDQMAENLNSAINICNGAYLAFLAPTEVVYHGCYTKLIERLKATKCAIAACGVRLCRRDEDGYITGKENYDMPVSKLDLWRADYLPLAGILIDQRRVQKPMQTSQSLHRREGYFLLLALSAYCEIDFSLMQDQLCEIRTKCGAPGSPEYLANLPEHEQLLWRQDKRDIEEWKSANYGQILIAEATAARAEQLRLQHELAALKEELGAHVELSNQVPGWRKSNEELARRCDALEAELARRPYKVVRRLMSMSGPVLRALKRPR